MDFLPCPYELCLLNTVLIKSDIGGVYSCSLQHCLIGLFSAHVLFFGFDLI